MKKDEVYKYLSPFLRNSMLTLKWDRGNGKLEETVIFEGFDEEKNPKLYFLDGRKQVDIDALGGYSSITSIKEFEPDGMC